MSLRQASHWAVRHRAACLATLSVVSPSRRFATLPHAALYRTSGKSAHFTALRPKCSAATLAAAFHHGPHFQWSSTNQLFSRTPVRLYRNIVENTLADTRSGYTQDPTAHPKRMVTYERLSTSALEAIDQLEEQEELLQRSELAYDGFTTPAIQKEKLIVFTPSSTSEQLLSAKKKLLEEATYMEKEMIGTDAVFEFRSQRAMDLVRMRHQLTKMLPRRHKGIEQNDSSQAPSEGETGQEAQNASGDGAEDTEAEKPHTMFVVRDDVNHVLYVAALACRRINENDEAEALLWEIISRDPLNVDAIESLVEVFLNGPDEKLWRLKKLLDALVIADERMRESFGGQGNKDSGDEDELDSPVPLKMRPFEVALMLLGDITVEAAARYYVDNGEGATSRFFAQAVNPLSKALGTQYTSLLIQALLSTMEEQYTVAQMQRDSGSGSAQKTTRATLDSSPQRVHPNHNRANDVDDGEDETVIVSPEERAAQVTMGIVISFLKMLLATNAASTVEEPIRFEFFVLLRLYGALRFTGRTGESYKIGERLIKLYRKNSGRYREAMANAAERNRQRDATAAEGDMPETVESQAFTVGILDDQEENYRSTLMQYIGDRAMDSAVVGKRLCAQALDEFPNDSEPWRLLSVILHKEDPVGNLEDAIITAKTALRVNPTDSTVVFLLANLYKAQKRYKLSEALLDRFFLLEYMLDSDASEEDMASTRAELLKMDELIPADAEEDEIELQFREVNEWLWKMEQANAYSMPIDKEPRYFNGTAEEAKANPVAGMEYSDEKAIFRRHDGHEEKILTYTSREKIEREEAPQDADKVSPPSPFVTH